MWNTHKLREANCRRNRFKCYKRRNWRQRKIYSKLPTQISGLKYFIAVALFAIRKKQIEAERERRDETRMESSRVLLIGECKKKCVFAMHIKAVHGTVCSGTITIYLCCLPCNVCGWAFLIAYICQCIVQRIRAD